MLSRWASPSERTSIPADFLVLDRGLADSVVHLVEVAAAQTTREVFVLRALEPLGHRVAADDGRWKNGQWRRHSVSLGQCRASVLPS